MPLQRIKANPIVTRDDIPVIPPHIADPTSVFNPGAIKVGDRYLLMLRVQTRGRETFLVMAESLDGIQFDVPARIVALRGLDDVPERVYHVYDPRITPLGERYVVMFAIDTDGGCRLGTAVTHDFRTFDVVAVSVSEDLRNGVVFPGQIGGRYVRLDRPNHRQLNGGPMTGDEICLSTSDDLVTNVNIR